MVTGKTAASANRRKPAAKTAVVGVIMGSKSDWPTMKNAADMLKELGVPFETKIVSAHRTPDRLADYAKSAKDRGLNVIIAGAGGAAHLPGMVAAMTALPVLGVPVESKALSGMDSLLSIVQMPGGITVGTLAIGTPGAKMVGTAFTVQQAPKHATAGRMDAPVKHAQVSGELAAAGDVVVIDAWRKLVSDVDTADSTEF